MPVLEIIAISTGCITIIRGVYAFWEGLPTKRDYASRVLSRSGVEPLLKPEVLRSQFAALPVIRQAPIQHHSHGDAAADRSSGSLMADHYARMTGLTPYFIQRSRADERNKRLGSRDYYWTKDVTAEPAQFLPPVDALLVMVDVDQYVDMPRLLLREFKPTMLYTFQPHLVSRTSKDYSFTFNQEDEVEYHVNGGGSFTHPVWNYGQDHLFIQRKILGITVQSATYLVERHSTSDDHEMILLTPVKKWKCFSAFVSSWLHGKGMERLKVVDGNYTRMEIQSKNGRDISTGKVGGYLQAKISCDKDSAIAIMATDSKYELNVASVEKFCSSKQEALLLWAYHKRKAGFKAPVVFPVEHACRRYQYDPDAFDPSWKASMNAFMSPLVHEGFAPDMCPNNDKAYVDKRILGLRKEVKPQITPIFLKILDEFIHFLIPEDMYMKGCPTTMDDVWERQSRPTQRRILHEAMFRQFRPIGGSFMKREAYQEPKDPRPITTTDAPLKAEYSAYIYPISDYLKKQKWYAFGKTPKEISDLVVDVARSAQINVVPTDASRWDGRLRDIMRCVEQAVLTAFYMRKYHEEALDLHGRHKGNKIYTTFGISYVSEDERGSGNPETAAFNSIGNKFNAYYYKRRTPVGGRYLTPEEAWNAPGVYGGDDGDTADCDPVKFTATSLELGIVLKTKEIKVGEAGLEMLARVYGPDVWYGDATSCCDIPRTLSKLHLTVGLGNIPATQKLFDKCYAIWLTDENTPIVGDFVTAVVKAGKRRSLEYHNVCNVWGGGYSKEEQYPNEPREWMLRYALTSLPGANLSILDSFLHEAKTLEDFLSPPLLVEPKAPEPQPSAVVSDGLKVEAKLKEQPKPQPKAKAKKDKPKKKEVTKKEWKRRPDGKPAKTEAH